MSRDRALRADLVDRLVASGAIRDARVERAMRKIERHRFISSASLEEAYRDEACLLKREHGQVLSTISQPKMVAIMLELAGLDGGERVLEVGTGSGYNAALLAELVGPEGLVVSVEIDADLSSAAGNALGEAGYAAVEVRLGDGELGVPEYAPYDLVIATAAVASVPPAWEEQLREGGRLVVPIEGRRSVVTLEKRGTTVKRLGEVPALFLPMR